MTTGYRVLVHAIAIFAATCGVLFIYGFLRPDRLSITTREDEHKAFSVVVTLPPVTTKYAWVQVAACAAEIFDDASVECIDIWDRKSVQETRADQRQYPFPYGRFVPRGKILVISTAYDANWQVLARGQKVVIR